MFGDIFHMLLGHCQAIAPRHEFSFPKKLYSLDATLIELCVKVFPWATYRQTKGAIKLNMLLITMVIFPYSSILPMEMFMR